jgi:hypothetical protein
VAPIDATDRNELTYSLMAHPAYGYSLVVSVDKAPSRRANSAPTAQRMEVIDYANTTAGTLLFSSIVSTGAETTARTKSVVGRTEDGQPIYAVSRQTTPVGLYNYTAHDKRSFSQSRQSPLHNVLWFGGENWGRPKVYAIHEVPRHETGRLGQRASGGCVRARANVSRLIYDLAAATETGWVLAIDRRSREPRRDAEGRVTLECRRKILVEVYDSSREERSVFYYANSTNLSDDEYVSFYDTQTTSNSSTAEATFLLQN